MLTYIGEYKEFNPSYTEFPSIKDSFCEAQYPGQDRIIAYLKNGGKEDMTSMSIQRDVITGDPIFSADTGRNDGVYTWWTSLAYYVEKYNLRLPEGFERHVLTK